MLAYQNKATQHFEELVELIIADRPFIITREREQHSDPFREKSVVSVGPFVKTRIEPLRTHRGYPVFDEKGTIASAGYILIGIDIPRELSPGVPTFSINDVIVDGQQNRYRVTAPPRYNGRVVELNLVMDE